MKTLLWTTTLWLGVLTTLPAQIKPLRAGETYVNGTLETVFVVPRASLEQILIKAQGFDTIAPLFAPLVRDTAILRVENRTLRDALGSERKEKWFIAALAAILGVALLLP